MRSTIALLSFLLLAFSHTAFAGTTGKIKGKITDANGEPLIGVNVIIEGTTKGVATDLDGNYMILNVKPGTYTLLFKYIGFATKRVGNVKVVVDKTTTIDVEMVSSAIQGEEIYVTAERPIVEKDRTTTTAIVDGEAIQSLPVVSIEEAIDLQAGVNGGHFRGGRIGEVAYMVNGVPINNAYNNQAAFEVEPNMISSLEVISGVFNAEYGQALSGVVNIVTKGVASEWTGGASAQFGTLASTRGYTFLDRTTPAGDNLNATDFTSRDYNFFQMSDLSNLTDLRLNLSGPIIKEKLGINLSARFFKEDGHLFSRNLFLPEDSTNNFNNLDNPETWRIESGGDGDFRAMNGGQRISINAGLNYELSSMTKINLNSFVVDGSFTNYNHFAKYVPEGRNTFYTATQNHILGLKHTFGKSTFGNVSYQYQRDLTRSYLYEDPTDPRHQPIQNSNTTGANAFVIGGNDLFQFRDLTQTHTVVGSVTSQVNDANLVKVGFEAHQFLIDNYNYDIDVNSNTDFQPRPTLDPFRRDSLTVRPYQFALYAQDKIELENLIINLGVRFDYFDANYEIPVDWSAADQLTIPDPDNPAETISNRRDAEAKFQLSPRAGLAFPISENGVLRFSYGMFFQRPALAELYRNPNYEVNPASTVNGFGNANIDPEQSTSFEIGLQYGFTDNIGMDMTVYSRDIRNLIGFRFERDFTTANLSTRLINQDIGTIRGVTLSFFQRMNKDQRIAWTVDYTLQFAEGSASNPADAFARAQSGQEENVQLQPLNWDRRHIINNTFTYLFNENLQLNIINQLRTGEPYTSSRFFVQSFNENNLSRPTIFTSDLRLTYSPPLFDRKVMIDLLVENITDSEAVVSVFNSTGFADQSLAEEQFRRSGANVGGINSLDEYYQRQGFFSRPRRVSLGIKYNF